VLVLRNQIKITQMKSLIKIFAVVVAILVIPACQKNPQDPTPTQVAVVSEVGVPSAKEGNSNARENAGLTMYIENAQKIKTFEKVVYAEQWLPNPTFRTSVNYLFTLNNVKAIDVSAGLSASVCSNASLIALMASACAEAKYNISANNSSSVAISKVYTLQPYEQRRFVIITKYNRFKGTYKYINGLTFITDPNVIVDIPIGSSFGDFQSQIKK
jgi:hypothetical protein